MKKFKLLYIGGTFDILHFGHFNLFRKAKEIADKVVVALNTDEFNERFKKQKTIFSLKERYRLIKNCGLVDRVVVNWGDEDSKSAILRVKPNAILHGDDWTGKSLMKQMGITQKFLNENKIKLIYLPYTEGISSVEIRKRIIKQYEAGNSYRFNCPDKCLVR